MRRAEGDHAGDQDRSNGVAGGASRPTILGTGRRVLEDSRRSSLDWRAVTTSVEELQFISQNQESFFGGCHIDKNPLVPSFASVTP